MAKRDIIGIGGSAGSTQALKSLLGELPAGMKASVFIATHLRAGRKQYLAEVLARVCALPVKVAEADEEIRPGQVYLAAPDCHLLVIRNRVVLGKGPRENMVRPAIDPMLRSLAMTYGSRVIGVILSGALNDGASGLHAIKHCGGLAVVQSPEDAEVAEMPLAALETVEADHLATAAAIGAVLPSLAETEAPASPSCTDLVRLEVEIAAGARLGTRKLEQVAAPAALTCPQCNGVLSQMGEAHPLRYRCQIGHAVTGEMLDDEQKAAAEEALRVAWRVMEERAELVSRMGKDARRQGRTMVAELYEGRHKEYVGHAEALRKAVLAGMEPMVDDEQEPRGADSD